MLTTSQTARSLGGPTVGGRAFEHARIDAAAATAELHCRLADEAANAPWAEYGKAAHHMAAAISALPGAFPPGSFTRQQRAAYRTADQMVKRWSRQRLWSNGEGMGRGHARHLTRFWLTFGAFAIAPYWDGSPLDGRTILIRADYGLGDWLHAARYLQALHEQHGGRIIVETQEPLLRLARSLPHVAAVVVRDTADDSWTVRAEYDTWVLGYDLVPLVGDRPDWTLPMPYLHADPALVDVWQRRLPPHPQLRVALVWSCDWKSRSYATRHIPLAALAPLASVPGVTFIGVQKSESLIPGPPPPDGGPSAEPAPTGLDILRLGPELVDMADTAAVLAACDLVISVDTSVAHLAAALGRPTLLLLHEASATHTPTMQLWGTDEGPFAANPTVRRFRQVIPDDWAPVVARVTDELHRLVAERVAA